MNTTEVKLSCKCGQHVLVPVEARGQTFACPTCGGPIAVPALVPLGPAPAPRIVTRPARGACIHCGGELQPATRRVPRVGQIIGGVVFLYLILRMVAYFMRDPGGSKFSFPFFAVFGTFLMLAAPFMIYFFGTEKLTGFRCARCRKFLQSRRDS